MPYCLYLIGFSLLNKFYIFSSHLVSKRNQVSPQWKYFFRSPQRIKTTLWTWWLELMEFHVEHLSPSPRGTQRFLASKGWFCVAEMLWRRGERLWRDALAEEPRWPSGGCHTTHTHTMSDEIRPPPLSRRAADINLALWTGHELSFRSYMGAIF